MANITIQLSQNLDEYAEFRGTITDVNADILIADQGGKIGTIKAVIVHRDRIPPRQCYTVFDSHSSELAWIGCALMEPKLARARLRSLADHDVPSQDFMYIEEFHVDDAYKQKGASDASALALRQFLHHPTIKKKVSIVAYVLSATEGMDPEIRQAWKAHSNRRDPHFFLSGEKDPAWEREQKEWDTKFRGFYRLDANAFLRNGFFQDPAIALDHSNENILVTSATRFVQPLRSNVQAKQIQFVSGDTDNDRAIQLESDKGLLDYVKQICAGWGYNEAASLPATIRPVSQNVRKYLQQGASISRSYAVHAAVANNAFEVVMLLLQMDPNAVNVRDDPLRATPLMFAALSAAGRNNKDGIADVRVLDYLLATGANINLKDKDGMTAYGHFVKQSIEYQVMMGSMLGHGVSNQSHATWQAEQPSSRAVQHKLLPLNGLSEADKSGGKRAGIIDYAEEDGVFNDSDEFDY